MAHGHGRFKFEGTNRAGVAGKNPLLRTSSNTAKGIGGVLREITDYLRMRSGKEDFFSRCEERFQSRPIIGDDSGAASGGFEKPH